MWSWAVKGLVGTGMAKEMLASQGIVGGVCEYFHMAAERSQVGFRGGRRAGHGSGPLPWSVPWVDARHGVGSGFRTWARVSLQLGEQELHNFSRGRA